MFKYLDKILDIHKINLNDIETKLEIINENNFLNQNPDNIIVNKKYLIGGSKYEFTYGDKKIIFFKSQNNKEIHYSIKENNSNEGLDCVLIIINDKIAKIHSLGILFGCQTVNKNIFLNGSDLLDITVNFLKFKRKELNINKITLHDISKKHCGTNSIDLSIMHTLLYGDTWYKSHGFYPIIETSSKIFVKNMLENNKNISLSKKIKDCINDNNTKKTYIFTYIENAYEEYKKKHNKITDNDIINLKKFIINNQEKTISDFLRYMLKDFKKYCVLFRYFYMELFRDMGYYNFANKSYYMNLDN